MAGTYQTRQSMRSFLLIGSCGASARLFTISEAELSGHASKEDSQHQDEIP